MTTTYGRVLLAAAAVSAALALGGCGNDEAATGGDGGGGAGGAPGSCTDDAGCGAEERCVDGACAYACDSICAAPLGRCNRAATPPACVACLAAADCAAGEACVNFACEPAGGCATDDDCDDPTRPACAPSGQCAECGDDADCGDLHCDASFECVACTRDDHCAAGEICNGEVCTPAGGCTTDAECTGAALPACDVATGTCVECNDDAACDAAAGETCDAATHTCVGPGGCQANADCADPLLPVCDTASGACVECLTDAECPAQGETCVASVCVRACLDSGDCAAGEICLAGSCEPGCGSDRDCPVGEHCDPQRGPNGTCVDCTDDAHCTAPETCNAEGICQECVADEDCADPALICQQFQCVAGCRADAACAANEICVDASCLVGCRADAACAGGEICENERCVTGCRDDAGCAAGEICDGLACRAGCRTDADCGQTEVCDPGTLTCLFRCASARDCPLETLCTDGTCIPGCVTDNDCDAAQGHICTAGACVDGCRDDAMCGVEEHCENEVCAPGCVTDANCANGEACDVASGNCVQCVTDADCGAGQVCDPTLFQCFTTCATNNDCNALWGAGTPFCDPSGICVECTAQDTLLCQGGVCDTADHVCVDCNTDADCAGDPGGPVCDPVTQECVTCRDDGDCTDPAAPACDVAGGACVRCVTDAHCAVDETCVVATNTCVPSTGLGQCDPCQAAANCTGIPNAQCVTLADPNGGVAETACAQGCAVDGDCPGAPFTCRADLGTPSAVCWPTYSHDLTQAPDGNSCTAYRSLAGAIACQQGGFGGDTCGVAAYDDAACLISSFSAGGQGQFGCTWECDPAAAVGQCPAGFVCGVPPGGSAGLNRCYIP